MDPRLTPTHPPSPQNAMQGMSPPVSAASSAPVPPVPPTQQTPATPPPANAVSQPMTPQIVASFPVKLQAANVGQPQPAISAAPVPPATNTNPQPEDDLDKILQAVNNRVKSPVPVAESKKKMFSKKLPPKTDKPSDKAKQHRPIGPVIIVLIIAIMLCATAIFAYRDGNRTATAAAQAGKVGTSYAASSAIQEAGGALVNPADLDDYAQTLQTKLSSLNDSQDFDSGSLSDQLLGL